MWIDVWEKGGKIINGGERERERERERKVIYGERVSERERQCVRGEREKDNKREGGGTGGKNGRHERQEG